MEVGSITKPIVFRQQDRSEAVRIIYFKDKIRPHRADIRKDYQKIKQAALNKKKVKNWLSGFKIPSRKFSLSLMTTIKIAKFLTDKYGEI